VIEAHCAYKKPARYEDLLEVDVEIGELRVASLRFVYAVYRGGDLLADGWTRHAVIGTDGRPRAMPEPMRNVIRSRGL
jgi:acyl-CoA thioester hydrolase